MSAALCAGDIRRAAALVAFGVQGDLDAQRQLVLDALEAGRFQQMDTVIELVWLVEQDPAVRRVLLDLGHLQRVIARLALAEARGDRLPPEGWLLPVA